MKSTKKKKKRSRAPNPVCKKVPVGEEDEESRALNALMEAFSSASLEEAVLAYREAKGDANKAAEILGGFVDNAEDPMMISSSSGSSSSCSGMSAVEGISRSNFGEDEVQMKGGVVGRKPKRVVAATGIVSSFLGKDYVRRDRLKQKGHNNEPVNKEDIEQFLCSMLGNEFELTLAVVRDVLCHCGYDAEKALDALLKLCAPPYGLSKNDRCCNHGANNKEDTRFLFECSQNFPDGASDSTSLSSKSEILDSVHSIGYGCRNYSEVLSSSKASCPASERSSKSDLSETVLQSLFNIPKSSEHEPNTMNWRNAVKKMESLGHGINYFPPAITESWQHTYAKGDEYQVFRKDAKQHWDSMRSCYQKAAAAYSNGDCQVAAYLSEQGKFHNKMAREADEKASREIFMARNKGIENVITIDMHGQHIKQAIRLLKVHLLFGTYVPSVQCLRVITGCGTHGVGKSKVKQSVIDLLQKEGIEWREENPGSLLIKLDGQRELSFLDSEDDSE
ncbi:SMR domain-containing protein At5g58720 [Malania oleifera]|uniref:SMR domain-containing protein At5g58720 n=1 Tax=Malania oleifera TaxID=397392 RepID=UPI0025AE1C52|nr:SMR domain-containing protein At5g58720 [Malania oleifera]